MSAPFDFFERLVLRAIGTFLIGALGAFGDFAAGSTSCTGGSSAVIFSAEGAVAASLFGPRRHCKESQRKEILHNSKGGKQVKKSIELAKYLRVQEVEKFYSPF
jgi:hypothetical protein